MCGIAGYATWRDSAAEPLHDIGKRMADTLFHRGPDDHGVWIDANQGVALGHRRLSIVDLSPAGHQPMASPTERYVTVYNGEIYNHRELRLELQRRGVAFRGGSDTEVLLAAIEAWGLCGALQKCVGMFALAVWDRQLRRLSFARDRMGEKPLFVARTREAIAFASEVRAFRAVPGFQARTNPRSVALLLRYGYLPVGSSIYEDVVQVPPGTIVSLDSCGDMAAAGASAPPLDGVFGKLETFWKIPDRVQPSRQWTVATAVDELELRLKEAVSLQMVADVPVGAFLSGGVDSSTVTALMCECASAPVVTFSVAFEDARYNEAHFAREVARHLGTDHRELHVSAQEALGVVGRLSQIYDEPFADPSQIPTYVIAAFARQSVTVALSGDGGDELFGGYNRYASGARLAAVQARLGRTVSSLGARVARGALAMLPAGLVAGLVARGGPVQDPLGKVRRACDFLASGDLASGYLGLVAGWPDPALAMPGIAHEDDALAGIDAALAAHGWFVGAMRWDLRHYLPGDNLTKVDRASMAVSLETRVPLLDHRVVELALEVATSLGAQRMVREPKYLLREVLYRRVPRALIDRPKMGFSVPLADWLRCDLRAWAEDLLSAQALTTDGWFAPDVVRRAWSQHVRSQADNSRQLWPLLMYQQWARQSRGDSLGMVA